jgi:hypothetical protein
LDGKLVRITLVIGPVARLLEALGPTAQAAVVGGAAPDQNTAVRAQNRERVVQPGDLLSGEVGPPRSILALGIVEGGVEDWVVDVGRPSVEPGTALPAAVDDQDLRQMNGEMIQKAAAEPQDSEGESPNLLMGIPGQIS